MRLDAPRCAYTALAARATQRPCRAGAGRHGVAVMNISFTSITSAKANLPPSVNTALYAAYILRFPLIFPTVAAHSPSAVSEDAQPTGGRRDGRRAPWPG